MKQVTYALAVFLLSGCQVLAAFVPKKSAPQAQRQQPPSAAVASSSANQCDQPPPSHVSGQDICCAAGRATWCIAHAQGAYADGDRARFLLQACELGAMPACEVLATRPEFERADAASVRKARARGCKGGSKKACDELDVWFATNAISELEDDERLSLARLLCERGKWAGRLTTAGYHLACVLHAGSLWSGSGLEGDRPKAIALMARSCDHVLHDGTRLACSIRLGRAYRDGDGVAADAETGAAFLRQGCLGKSGGSFCLEAGQACEAFVRQEGSSKMTVADCYDPACRAGSAEGCEAVGAFQEAADQLEEAGTAYGRAKALGSTSATEKFERVVRIATTRESNRRQALLRSIPKLFGECEVNRAKLEHWRVIAVAAQRKRDSQRLEQADAALRDLDPTWTATIEKLREAIVLASAGDQDKYTQFADEILQRCMCMRSRTGHCG